MTELFDRVLWRRRLARAHAEDRPATFLHERAVDDLIERLMIIKRSFPVAIDLGAFHGGLSRRLAALDSVGTVIACEASPPLLADCPSPKIGADEEWLPFGPGTADLVVSALALQHVNDLPGTLAQVARVLRPDGLFLAAMIGGETLKELRDSFLTAEAEIRGQASPRVAPFADMRDLGGLLRRAGFALPVVDNDVITVTYGDPLQLLGDLRAMGATNVLVLRDRSPMRRTVLMRAMEVYRERYSGQNGRVSATFEIITLTGWVPHPSQQQPLAPGSAKTSLADVLLRRRR